MAINKADRARQFLPFDALKGFQEALREKEIIYDVKKELAEDEKENISNQLLQLSPNDQITVVYYHQKFYQEITGTIKKLDNIKKKIILTDETSININNIIKLEIL